MKLIIDLMDDAQVTKAIEILSALRKETPPKNKMGSFHADDSISVLGIKGRTYNCLIKEGIETIGQLSGMTVMDVVCVPGMGNTGVNQLRDLLRKFGLFLKNDE